MSAATLARARRVRGRLDAARQGLWIVQGFGGEGSGAYVRAELVLLQAELHWAEGLHRESLDLLERAARIYARIGDPAREGAVRLRHGMALRKLGDLEAARAALDAALALLSAGQDAEARAAAEAARLAVLLQDAEAPLPPEPENGDERGE